MEIFAFLKLTRGRLAVLVLVALIGAGAGVAYMAREPQTWDFTARIRAGDIFAPGAPTYEVAGFNSMVVDALQDDRNLAKIATSSKADIDLVNSMEISQPSEGGPVIVTVEADDKTVGTAVVTNAGAIALQDVASRKLAVSQAAAEKTGPEFNVRQKQLDDFQARTGYGYGIPETIKQLVGVDIPALETALATADAASKPDITARLDEARAQVQQLQTLLPEASAIYRRIDQAYSNDVDAQKDLAQAKQWVATAASPGEAVAVEEPVLRSRTPILARGAVGGAALGGLLAGLILFLTRPRATGEGGADRRKGKDAFWASEPAAPSVPGADADSLDKSADTADESADAVEEPVGAERVSRRGVTQEPSGRLSRFPHRLA